MSIVAISASSLGRGLGDRQRHLTSGVTQKCSSSRIRVEIRKGEQINFVLHNTGEPDHEFVLATTQENLEHAEMMKNNPEMRHDDPNARCVAPNQTSQIVWKFTKAGEFEFACLIPGHRDAGMFGIVDVK
jgi:uncharacterized cupredoxin-like copper-binding protein